MRNAMANHHDLPYSAPGGEHRSVTLVQPREANAPEVRISVLSPVGHVLLGCTPGLRILASEPGTS
jgi:transcription elongation GreA/GreB family factor